MGVKISSNPMASLGSFRNNLSSKANISTELLGWLMLSATLLIGFLSVGLRIGTSTQILCALVVYSIPFYFATYSISSTECRLDAMSRLVIGFGLGSITLALIFGFSQIAGNPRIFWILGLVSSGVSYFKFKEKRKQKRSERDTPSISTVLILFTIVVSITLAALAQRFSWPVDDGEVKWLPDDIPIFARWSEALSLGGMHDQIMDGFTLKYHWLSYSFIGGLDRLFSEDFFGGSVQFLPVIAWTGLAFGALALTRLQTKSFSASFLAVTSVLFSTTVGLLLFSRVGVGGTVVSPSHLLSASWLLAIVLIGFLAYPISLNPRMMTILFFILGFSLALTKFSAFAVAAICFVVLAYFRSTKSGLRSADKYFRRGLLYLGAVSSGGLIAYLIFIRGGEVDFAFDEALQFDFNTSMTGLAIQLLPLGAATFSLLVLLLPVLVLFNRQTQIRPLVVASISIALVGLAITTTLELRDANETWFIAEGLAIILPVSCVLIADFISNIRVSKFRINSTWIVLGLFTTVTTVYLLSVGENPEFLVRPWLNPFILVLGSFMTAIIVVFVLHGKNPLEIGVRSILRLVGPFIVIALFLTSISYGIGLRATAAISSRTEVSQARDLWLKGAQDLIDSDKLDPNSSFVAVYSTSEGEHTLVRWIPYLADKQSYFLRDEDLLRYIYVSTDSSDMLARESDVQSFIEDGSRSSCLALQQAGISQIWVTPNANFDGSRVSESFEHALIDVDCDSRE